MWFQLITGLKKNHFLIVCQLPEDSKDKMYTSTSEGEKKEYVCSRRMHVRYVQQHPGDTRGCVGELYVLH